MTTIKRIPLRCAETPLQRHVRRWLNAEGRDGGYDYGASGVYEDLMHGGCVSGTVGHLIYYRDTVRFYRRHMREIDEMLKERCRDCGESPASLFGDQWDKDDPLARADLNQNLLAWFGFEEAARVIMDRAEQELEA